MTTPMHDGEICWLRPGPHSDMQTLMLRQGMEAVTDAFAGICRLGESGPLAAISVMSAALDMAARTFATASVDALNSDGHIAMHLDEVCLQFKVRVQVYVEAERERESAEATS